MKAKKVEKVITTLKDRIGHPLEKYLTEISTWVANLKGRLKKNISNRVTDFSTILNCCNVFEVSHVTLERSVVSKMFRGDTISKLFYDFFLFVSEFNTSQTNRS